MRFLKPYKLFEMAAMPAGMPQVYYHGTSSQDAGEKILEEGFLKPGNTDVKRGQKLTPMMNYVYCTPDIYTACIYTIGGVFMGSEYKFSTNVGNRLGHNSQFGYCFEIDVEDLKDVKPDEDFVGELIWFLHEDGKADYMAKGESSFMWRRAKKWRDENPHDAQRYLDFARRNLTELQFKKAIRYDDYADFAVAGKKLNKVMDNATAQQVMSLGCPVANLGQVKISEAWKLDKARTKDIKKDASNFFEIAEKVK